MPLKSPSGAILQTGFGCITDGSQRKSGYQRSEARSQKSQVRNPRGSRPESRPMAGEPPSSVVPPHRILVRGVNWLGDAVMTTPALERLRQALPEAHITLLTDQKLAGLWPQHPSIDAVITFAPSESPRSIARRL